MTLEMNPVVTLAPIRIKLYPYEAKLLNALLLKITLNVVELKGKSYNGYIVLAEWYVKYFMGRSFSIEQGSAKIPKRVDMPVSVARYLMDEMTQTSIPIELNIILGQLHRQLTNKDLLPL
jgi:hypothetical protein